MSDQVKLTRRDVLRTIGLTGGSAAVHETLVALGLMRHPSAWAGPPKSEPMRGKGQEVLILGAGVGGLATAYWLGKNGYRCTVLEAQERIGGRSFTARHGSVVTEQSDEHGPTTQLCKIDDDPRLYINLGPGRIPYHHRRVLDLCRELDVPLEVYVHTSDFNLHRMANGKLPMDRAIERRRIIHDTQGYISELLAKAINQDALDHELQEGDRDKLLGLLQKFGDLNSRYRYKGSTRAGCLRLPVGVKTGCGSRVLDALKPLELEVLLDSEFWDPCLVGEPVKEGDECRPESFRHGFYQVKEHLWQTTSFQPVGGMDKIVEALTREIKGQGGSILTNLEVEKVTLDGKDEVRVFYWDRKNLRSESKSAKLCISNVPLTVLQRDRIDLPQLSPAVRGAISRAEFSEACKVGWQANHRFWEDRGIYGGISWVQHDITQMWYPSNDYLSRRGTLIGAFNYQNTALRFGKLSIGERLKKAREGGALLHPNAFADGSNMVPEKLGISIAWQNVPFQRGCSANWHSNERQDELDYESLLVPDTGMNQRFFFVGDQVSTLPGWQEGALMSAEHVVHQITTGEDLSLEKMRREVTRAPMSLQVMG